MAAGVLAGVVGGRWVSFQPSQLPLGAWLLSPEIGWRQVVDSLLRRLPGFPVTIGITQQDPERSPRPENDSRVDDLDYVNTGWVDVVGTFDAFWEGRGKNLRQNLRKQRRKLEEQGGDMRFDVLSTPAK